MKKHFRTIVCALAACGAAASAGPLLNTNLIINGDAETGSGSTDGSVVAVPNWTQVGVVPLFTAVQYQPIEGNFPSTTDPGPASRGTNFFAGGPNIPVAFGQQVIDISGISGLVDSGNVNYTLSGYLGGFSNQDDFTTLEVLFLDGGNNQINFGMLTGPSTLARGSQTGLLFETFSSVIPVGTRTLQFELEMTRQQGSYDDGYADNLSFVATSVAPAPGVPEPATFAMFTLGAVALAALSRRARQQ